MLPLLLALTAAAAPPDAGWRTIRTEHFDLHYPTDAEDWATQAAARLESMHARVEEQVGTELDKRITVVVKDPYATANGMAVPFRRSPRTELWISPPVASSVIGWNRRWDEGLIVHEDTHLVHLAMPSRGGLDKVLQALTGLGPVSLKVPRWVAEGYATVVEGDQTGYGRPFSARQAADIRRLATEGRLPSYGELNGTSRWGGGGFAYGIGSAYLIWLRDRTGPDSLRHLWRRLTAVQYRDFNEAFEGVFGDSPEVLYGRFVAETTADAMALEAARPAVPETRWIDLDEATGMPDVSPDGEHLVLMVDEDDRRRLVVYATKPDEEAARKREEAIAEMLERDPLDVAAVEKPEPMLERVWTRTRRDRNPWRPRWIDDKTILFTGTTADPSGRLRTDLFTWTPSELRETRLTRFADVMNADPSPDGSWAVGVRQRWGAGGLVRIDLDSGDVTELTPVSVDTVYDQPRVSPDGRRIAYLRMQDSGWALMVANADGTEAHRVSVPSGAQLATPAWHPDGAHLLVSLGLPTLLEVAALPVDGGEARIWTRSHGGALGPVVAGEVFYWVDEDAEGRDVHRMPVPDAAPTLAEAFPDVPDAPLAIQPEAPEVPLPGVVEAPVSRRYGLGPSDVNLLFSGVGSRHDAASEAVIRVGDPIGRRELLLIGGLRSTGSTNAWAGRAAFALRVLPFDLHLGGWGGVEGQSGDLRLGVGGAVQDTHQATGVRIHGAAGGLFDPGLDGATPRTLGHGTLTTDVWEPGSRLASVGVGARFIGGQVGDGTGGWLRGGARLALLRGGIQGRVQVDQALGDVPDLSLGGVREATLPSAWQGERIVLPSLPSGVATGRSHVGTRVQLGGELGLFYDRHVVGEGLDPLGPAWGQLGLGGTFVQPRMPFVRVPETVITGGVACTTETPDDGFSLRTCRSLASWTAWGGLTVRR